jgi:hypothetical protein
MGSLVHTGLGSSSLVAHVLPYPPPPPCKQLCTRSCSNKHTHICGAWFGFGSGFGNYSHTPPRTRSPSSRHPPFTHYPFPLRSLVCGGQPSPHKPRLVVSHSTCPPLSSSPHAHIFVLGPAVINTHTHNLTHHLSFGFVGASGVVLSINKPHTCPFLLFSYSNM